MYQQDEGSKAIETNWSAIRAIDPSHMDPTIEKLTVKGSEAFIYLLIEKLKNSFGSRVIETSTTCMNGEVLAEISVNCSSYSTRGLVDSILSALTETLKSESIKMDDTAIISFEKYKLMVDSNVIDAVRNGHEITYVISYLISKELRGNKAFAIASIIEYYHDTCCSYFYKNELIVDRYHYASFEEPLPNEEIHRLFFDARYVLSQFREVQAIVCDIKATGIEEGHCN